MGGLHLLSPWGLALLAGAVPLVVLYTLKIKRRRQPVSSTWLWTGAQRDLMAKLKGLGRGFEDVSLDTVRMFYDDAQSAGFAL